MDSIVVVVDSWIQSISFGFEDFLMDLINCCLLLDFIEGNNTQCSYDEGLDL
jgi:hypothetical protein